MDPMLPVAPLNPSYPVFIAGIFDTNQDRDDYLDSLDSDTRDYVINHTGEFSSREDLMNCVRRLHGE